MNELLKRIEELEADIASLKMSVAKTEEDHIVPTKEHIGLLVEVWDFKEDEKTIGVLSKIEDSDGAKYWVCGQVWFFARLYSGPTIINWRKHDGGGKPKELRNDDVVLYQRHENSSGYPVISMAEIITKTGWDGISYYSIISNPRPTR